MKSLKINLFILYLLIAQSECGFLNSVIGTVKNTTNALRADIHNAISYGNDLVFGESKKPIEGVKSDDHEEPKTEGLFTNLYHKSVNTVSNFTQRVRNLFVKDDNAPPHKGIITKVFGSVNKKLKTAQDYFEPSTDPTKNIQIPVGAGPLLDNDSKVVRDKVIHVLFQNNTNVFNKLNISESDIYDIFKDLKDSAKGQIVLPPNDVLNNDVTAAIDVRSLADTVKNGI